MSLDNELFSSFEFKSKKYYIMQKWTLNDQKQALSLLITDCTNCWTANYTMKELEKSSNLTNFDINGIKLQLKQAFGESSKADYLVDLRLSDDYTQTTVTLKKLIEGDIKVEIATFKLTIVDDPTPKTQNALDFCIERIKSLECKVDSLQVQLKQLESEKNEAVQMVEECVKQKDELESDLYSKFVCILNEKKAKIKELASNSE